VRRLHYYIIDQAEGITVLFAELIFNTLLPKGD